MTPRGCLVCVCVSSPCDAAECEFVHCGSVPGSLLNGAKLQYVHQAISGELAAALGITSLRESLLVTQSLKKDFACWSAPDVRAQVRRKSISNQSGTSNKVCLVTHVTSQLHHDFPAHTFLLDLLELADLAGARKFELLIDERLHAAQSLVNPGFASCQV